MVERGFTFEGVVMAVGAVMAQGDGKPGNNFKETRTPTTGKTMEKREDAAALT